MRKMFFVSVLLASLLANVFPASAQSDEAEQLLLDVQKLGQLRRMLLDMKQGYEIVSTGYNTIRDLSEGNFNLHEVFLDGLLQVSPAVRKCYRVQEIITDQLQLVSEYKSALGHFKEQGSFSPEELKYMEGVYGRLLDGSLKDLDDLATILTAGKLRMSDEQRLEAIDGIYDSMQDRLSFLTHFNHETAMLGIQRGRVGNDVHSMEGIFGTSNE